MKISKDISLKKYNTFGIDHKADCLISIKTEEEAVSLFGDYRSLHDPVIILGGGSNVLFTGDFKGTVIHPEIKGINIEEKHPGFVIVSCGSGVKWDELVEWSVNKGYGGLENLSLIPGSVGASPVQNIGAYGVEAKDSIEKVKTICLNDGSVRIFSNEDCEFEYRNSIFKKSERGKYLIIRVYYKLIVNPLFNLKYGSLAQEVNKLGNVTLRNVREAVINIRRSKLPDPDIIGNAGSYFKNPIIGSNAAETLRKIYPQIPIYEDQSGGTKLAAGWLIDQCGWRGKRFGDCGVHDKQALVLVNFGKATGKEIYNLSERIRQSVLEKFRVVLEREVEVVGII